MLVFLVGMPACGKSRKGSYIADKLGYSYIDTDKAIEKREQKSIAEIFSQQGEWYFRKKENELLQSIISADNNTIISCGGGFPCFNNNMEIMNKKGICIYIKVNLSLLTTRIENKKNKRPLLAGKSTNEIKQWLQTTLQQRESIFMQSSYIVEASYIDLYEFYQYVYWKLSLFDELKQ